MVNAGVKPNIHTYGALIDGCARAGQVGKAFGVYGIMRSKVRNMMQSSSFRLMFPSPKVCES
jgi:pentatricopeptide repeat protein